MMLAKEKQNYERELKILQNVNHPFIIRYIDEFIYDKDYLCIVTQYASGGDLDTKMENRKEEPFSEEEAMNYFTMILIGLHSLHSKKIYHRDLKPANILLDSLSDGTEILKIGDFGISKAADLVSMKLSKTSFFGTLSYMAPESLDGK
jgi:NIMA (never in mitosis gene a)-related kinase 1/4/5